MADQPVIEFYGAAWCGDCRRAQVLLDHYGIDYSYHDIDASAEDKATAIEISGRNRIPVLVFPDGSFLSEPAGPILQKKLEDLDMV